MKKLIILPLTLVGLLCLLLPVYAHNQVVVIPLNSSGSSCKTVAPCEFSMEWLYGRTLYGVWYGNGEDAQGGDIPDVAVVVKQVYNPDQTVTYKGLRNFASSGTGVPYGVTASGGLYYDDDQSGVNKIVCGGTSQYVKTHYIENNVFNNVDLYFFDESDALNYANTLTESIPPCTN